MTIKVCLVIADHSVTGLEFMIIIIAALIYKSSIVINSVVMLPVLVGD